LTIDKLRRVEISIAAQKSGTLTPNSSALPANFAARLDTIAKQLKQLSADIKSGSTPPRSEPLKTTLPKAQPKLAAWQKPASQVNTINIHNGDSLSKIAKKTGTSVKELLELNHIKNGNRIKAGRKIIISEKPSTDHLNQTGATQQSGPTQARAEAMKNAAADQGSQQVGPTRARAGAIAKGVSAHDRDTMVRTVIGEANNQGPRGQEAVAHVLMNRAADPRFPHNLTAVAKQRKQFSAWNSGVGGNSLVRKDNPGSIQYERAAKAVDRVLSGQSKDPTGGATHYYSPAGMRAHVARGEQHNLLPRWLQAMNNERGGGPTKIGGHLFTGKARIG